jgi:hypothetical protein
LYFLSGQMIYRVSPCTSPRACSPAKTRKGLQESPKATTTTTTTTTTMATTGLRGPTGRKWGGAGWEAGG